MSEEVLSQLKELVDRAVERIGQLKSECTVLRQRENELKKSLYEAQREIEALKSSQNTQSANVEETLKLAIDKLSTSINTPIDEASEGGDNSNNIINNFGDAPLNEDSNTYPFEGDRHSEGLSEKESSSNEAAEGVVATGEADNNNFNGDTSILLNENNNNYGEKSNANNDSNDVNSENNENSSNYDTTVNFDTSSNDPLPPIVFPEDMRQKDSDTSGTLDIF